MPFACSLGVANRQARNGRYAEFLAASTVPECQPRGTQLKVCIVKQALAGPLNFHSALQQREGALARDSASPAGSAHASARLVDSVPSIAIGYLPGRKLARRNQRADRRQHLELDVAVVRLGLLERAAHERQQLPRAAQSSGVRQRQHRPLVWP
jgi:hypothetical protein